MNMVFYKDVAVLTVLMSAAIFSSLAYSTSVNIQVSGTINPSACVPTISNGGVVDLGHIRAASLDRAKLNILQPVELTLMINCDGATKVAMRTIDNRPGTSVPGAAAAADVAVGANWTDKHNFGLGAVSEVNVGGYVLAIIDGMGYGDERTFLMIESPDGGVSWVRGQSALVNSASTITSWSTEKMGAPEAFTNMTIRLYVAVVLNRGDALPLTAAIPIDGLATIELIYL